MVVSYILANVALRAELNRVFDALFNSGGSDIIFVSAKQFGLAGEMSFQEISSIVESFKMIAIGVMEVVSTDITLNPDMETKFSTTEKLKIIVIS